MSSANKKIFLVVSMPFMYIYIDGLIKKMFSCVFYITTVGEYVIASTIKKYSDKWYHAQ